MRLSVPLVLTLGELTFTVENSQRYEAIFVAVDTIWNLVIVGGNKPPHTRLRDVGGLRIDEGRVRQIVDDAACDPKPSKEDSAAAGANRGVAGAVVRDVGADACC